VVVKHLINGAIMINNNWTFGEISEEEVRSSQDKYDVRRGVAGAYSGKPEGYPRILVACHITTGGRQVVMCYKLQQFYDVATIENEPAVGWVPWLPDWADKS
jgi:hypothetical protein